MSYVYLLAGENIELARADLRSFLRSQDLSDKIETKDRLAFSSSEASQLRRLALTHEVGRVIFRGRKEDFEPELPDGSFKVRAETLEDTDTDKEDLEREIGSMIESESTEVDLEDPEHTYRAFIFEDEIVVAERILDIDRSLFEERSNEKRPFSSPVSLDPVLARIMVNLSELPPGEFIFDPFCGTGGILIEAGLCGIGVKGSDLSEEMVEGCRDNLEEYGIINHDIRALDVERSVREFEDFEAIVTDLPYGKASTKENKPVKKFLDTLESFSGKTVFCYKEPELGDFESDYEIYVHKSLTRYIYVI